MTLTEEHVSLKAVTRRFLAARYPVDRIVDSGPTLDGWATLADLGWWGKDAGALDRALIAEECGYALLPLPWRGQLTLGGRVEGAGTAPIALAPLPPTVPPGHRVPRTAPTDHTAPHGSPADDHTAAHGSPPNNYAAPHGSPADDRTARTAPTNHTAPHGGPADGLALRVEVAGDCVLLTGTVTGVPDVEVATRIAVVVDAGAGPVLVFADTAGVSVETEPGLDTLRPSSRVTFDATPATAGAGDLTLVHRLGEVLLAAEAVGVAQRAYDMAVDYAGTRTQFGKVIGAYQAIAFAIADSYMHVELARALVHRAAWLTEAATTDASIVDDVVETAVAGAVVAARACAVESCERAVQVFGGLGMTWENPLHHWYRRALWLDGAGRSTRAQLDRIATAVLGA